MLAAAEVPSSRVYSVVDMFADRNSSPARCSSRPGCRMAAAFRIPGIVPKLSETPGGTEWLGVELGAHTDAVLAGLGYSAERIIAMKTAGATGRTGRLGCLAAIRCGSARSGPSGCWRYLPAGAPCPSCRGWSPWFPRPCWRSVRRAGRSRCWPRSVPASHRINFANTFQRAMAPSSMARSDSVADSARCTPCSTSGSAAFIASTAPPVSAWMATIICSISVVAVEVRSASLRTSSATTAKPRPCSGRAASMAALRAAGWSGRQCLLITLAMLEIWSARLSSVRMRSATPATVADTCWMASGCLADAFGPWADRATAWRESAEVSRALSEMWLELTVKLLDGSRHGRGGIRLLFGRLGDLVRGGGDLLGVVNQRIGVAVDFADDLTQGGHHAVE